MSNTSSLGHDAHLPEIDQMIAHLIDIGGKIDAKGWCPATGGNFSFRSPAGQGQTCYVTSSGTHKGALTSSDLLEVDLEGVPVHPSQGKKPSAETLVHVMLYRLDHEIGAVLHAHSIPNTVLSFLSKTDQLMITGLEMQKSIRGMDSHEDTLAIEVFNNTQDMTALASRIEARWIAKNGCGSALLVRGHGVYVWGRSLQEAWRHLEGIEFLLACELELAKLGASQSLRLPKE